MLEFTRPHSFICSLRLALHPISPCSEQFQFLPGGQYQGGDFRADEKRGGEQTHGENQDERAQQSVPHNIQVPKNFNLS